MSPSSNPYSNVWDDPESEDGSPFHASWCEALTNPLKACDCGSSTACPVCGEVGPCSYDSEGNPLNHSGRDSDS